MISTLCLAFPALLALQASALKTSFETNACSGVRLSECVQKSQCLWEETGCRKTYDNPTRSRCNNGTGFVDCFDSALADCAKAGKPKAGDKWAFVFTHSLERGFTGFNGKLVANMKSFQDKAAELGNTDVVLLVPKVGSVIDGSGKKVSNVLSEETKERLLQQNVLVKEVAWALPPNMKYVPVPKKGEPAWCGAKDLMRLHALGLDEYAALAYFDTDTQLTGNGDFGQVFRCAASGAEGHFLTTSGPMSPLNVGMFALKPSRALLDAAVHFAQTADYDPLTGWGEAGLSPNRGSYVGSECGQGFTHALMYKTSTKIAAAVKKAGYTRPPAVQLDRCIWNRQHDTGCERDSMDCDKVVMIHKDGGGKAHCTQKHPISMLQVEQEFPEEETLEEQ